MISEYTIKYNCVYVLSLLIFIYSPSLLYTASNFSFILYYVPGLYFDNSQPIRPSRNALDAGLQRWLWIESEKLVNIPFPITTADVAKTQGRASASTSAGLVGVE